MIIFVLLYVTHAVHPSVHDSYVEVRADGQMISPWMSGVGEMGFTGQDDQVETRRESVPTNEASFTQAGKPRDDKSAEGAASSFDPRPRGVGGSEVGCYPNVGRSVLCCIEADFCN